ncbi:MAG: hypothetical protein AAFP82_22340, partial [Bacteroidota bacterium]
MFFLLFVCSFSTSAQQTDIFDASSPNLRVRSTSGSVQLGIATCDGCFSSISKKFDAILRTDGQATGNLIIAARSKDGIIFSTGDGNTDAKRMEIFNDGKVVIGNVGSTPSDYKLYVENGILAERLKVAVKTSADWADYVFEDDYHLLPLDQVKTFIEKNKHLPAVPSAEDMVKQGMDVLEMNAILLLKIEELMLYTIELNEKIKTLEKHL